MLMLTLTVDPKLFSNPEEAYRYVRRKRCVAELVRALLKAGFLYSRRFFYVVEWQKNTEMAHFHLLVEADFIPFHTLAALWARFRPVSAGPPQGDAPAFGHVHISKVKFLGPEHAANYACKYLTKLPEQGFPQWVLNFEGQIRMFATSRGLLPQKPRAKEEFKPTLHDKVTPHRDTCFCERCRGETVETVQNEVKVRQSTVGQRLMKCGQRAALIAVPMLMRPDGELVEGKRVFVEPIQGASFREISQCFDIGPNVRRFRLRDGEREKLAAWREYISDPAGMVTGETLARVMGSEQSARVERRYKQVERKLLGSWRTSE
jgi:hypothetical protein